jgi:hypothetical protein
VTHQNMPARTYRAQLYTSLVPMQELVFIKGICIDYLALLGTVGMVDYCIATMSRFEYLSERNRELEY